LLLRKADSTCGVYRLFDFTKSTPDAGRFQPAKGAIGCGMRGRSRLSCATREAASRCCGAVDPVQDLSLAVQFLLLRAHYRLTVKPIEDPAHDRQIANQAGDRASANAGLEDERKISKNTDQEDVATQDAQRPAWPSAKQEQGGPRYL
jgi:hypothetical protein